MSILSCPTTGKTRYATKQEALDALGEGVKPSRREKPGTGRSIQKCHGCRGYHLSKKRGKGAQR